MLGSVGMIALAGFKGDPIIFGGTLWGEDRSDDGKSHGDSSVATWADAWTCMARSLSNSWRQVLAPLVACFEHEALLTTNVFILLLVLPFGKSICCGFSCVNFCF